MSGELNLDRLIAGMTPVLAPEVFVFVTLAPELPVPAHVTPIMTFQEREGMTLILTRDGAEQAGLDYEFPCRCITLTVHSALDAVGFLARIATALAAAGMGVNPVAGFHHDHLFIPDGREDEAMEILRAMAAKA